MKDHIFGVALVAVDAISSVDWYADVCWSARDEILVGRSPPLIGKDLSLGLYIDVVLHA